MPTVTGAWVPNSTTNQRMRLVIEYSTSQSASTVSGSGSVYVEAGYSFNDSSNTFTASGTLISAFSGSKSINVASNGRQKMHDFTFSHARGSSSASRSMAFSLTGVNYVGSSQKASVSALVSIPAGVKPATPGSVTIARVSLTRVRVSWTGGAAHHILWARRQAQGSSTAGFGPYWEAGTAGQARTSPFEFDVDTGYEYAAAVRRVDGGISSDNGYSPGVARLYDAPPAPSSVGTTRQADNRHTTSWSFSDTASTRATAMEINKWQQRKSAWGNPTSLAGSARSHIDTASHPNDRLRWGVRAVNGAGGSAWVNGPYISTTPAAPTGVSASRSGATDIVVSLTNKAVSSVAKIDIQGQSSTDGVTWSSWANITGHTGITSGAVGAVISRTITTLDPARRWRFRAIAWVQEPTYLSATSATSNAILLLQAPAAPKLTAPVVTQPADTKLTFRWSHQALDGSGQTAAGVRYRLDGGAWATLSVTGSGSSVASAVTIPAGSLEWQARTKGVHADWSAWSGVVSVQVAQRPTVTITAPADGAPWPSNRLTLAAAYGDGSGAAGVRYRRVLRDAVGTVLEDATVTRTITDGTSVPVAYRAVLADGVTYVAELTVTSGTGLASVAAQVTVPVAYLLPGMPMLVGVWAPETATVALQVANSDGGGVAETVANRIERSVDGGVTWTELVDGLGPDAAWTDPLPPFQAAVLYRVAAISALGAETLSDPIEVDATHGEIWIVGEDGATLVLGLALSIDPEWGHERVSEQYLGDRYPTAHYGQARPVMVRVSAAQLDGHGIDSEPWLLLGQDVYYRDPEGRAMWASITSGPSLPQTVRGVRTISLTLEAVEHAT